MLIVGGGLAMAGSNSYSLWLLWVGLVAHAAGWCIQPSAGWRRIVAVLPSSVAMLGLLAGPHYLAVLVIPYIGWLLVRHRPGRSYPTVIFPLASAVIIWREVPADYAGMLPALGIELAVIVISGFVARVLAIPTRSSPAASMSRREPRG